VSTGGFAEDYKYCLKKETWDNYIKRGVVTDPNIRPHILKSWERCKGIDPTINPTKNDKVFKFLFIGRKAQKLP